jgi:hypothetical protein
MGGGLDNPNQAKSFDLFRNPFYILGVEPSTSFQQVIEACDDAISRRPSARPDLMEARQILLNARDRVAAELSCLLDTRDGEAAIILDGMKNAASFQDITIVADDLAPLSRANLLAHAASQEPAKVGVLFGLVDAHARIDHDSVYAMVHAVRSRSGVALPDRLIVDEELQSLLARHCKAALAAYETPAVCAEAIMECAKRIFNSPNPHRIDALGRMIRTFEPMIAPNLLQFEQEIELGTQSIRARPKEVDLLEPISTSLRNWIILARPLVELDAYLGRDEERAWRLFNELRALSLELANDHDSSELALSVTKIVAEVFKSLPHATERLMEDVPLLQGQTPEANVVSLQKCVEAYHEDFSALVKDLEAREFDQHSTGGVKELWDQFAAAAKKMEPTNIADLPWFVVRNVAIAINNREGSPRAAKSLIDGMLAFSQSVTPSATVYGLLSKDLHLAEHNILQQQLAVHIKANRFAPALRTITELQKNPQSSREAQTLDSLKGQLNRKRAALILKLSAVVVVFGLIMYSAISKKIPGFNSWQSSRTSNAPDAPLVRQNQPVTENALRTIPTPPMQEALNSPAPDVSVPPEGSQPIPTQPAIQTPLPPGDREAEVAPVTAAPPDIDLLQIEVSVNVQKRLSQLGYFRGTADGTWGPQSRNALWLFKRANGLTNDDAFDTATAFRLLSSSAIRSPTQAKDPPPQAANSETNYPPPAGATLNPLNRADAVKINTKLRELGFYRSPNTALWGAASRDALKDFKISSQLSEDDAWDASTEQHLITAGPALTEDIEAGFFAATGGSWSTDVRACPGGSGGSDALVMTVVQKRAMVDGAYCEFSNLSGRGTLWKAQGTCVVNGETKKSNINFNRSGNVLVWSSANGVTKYLRCPR